MANLPAARCAVEVRALYCHCPRALLAPLDENIRLSESHPDRLRGPDALLGLLRGMA
jgi:hypothetical protein